MAWSSCHSGKKECTGGQLENAINNTQKYSVGCNIKYVSFCSTEIFLGDFEIANSDQLSDSEHSKWLIQDVDSRFD